MMRQSCEITVGDDGMSNIRREINLCQSTTHNTVNDTNGLTSPINTHKQLSVTSGDN